MSVYIKSTSAISAQNTFEENGYFDPWLAPNTPFLTAQEPEYTHYLEPNISRRMSRVIKMGTTTAKKALAAAEVQMPGAIVVGTGLGCSADTEKFLSSIIQSNEGLLSPTAFIQSTHNSIAGQIALILQCTAYNFTYTNRGHSFENALKDAWMLLSEGEDNILLGGIDEATPMVYKAFLDMGCVGNNAQGSLLPVFGEGSTFFVLSHNANKSLACLNDMMTFGRIGPGLLAEKLKEFLSKNDVAKADVDMLVLGYNRDYTDRYYTALRSIFDENIAVSGFKQAAGEYFTSIAFGLHHTVKTLQKCRSYAETFVSGNLECRPSKILIYNHYEGFNHTFILVSKDG